MPKQKKRPPFYFSNICQKLTDLNDFGVLNPEKIWHHSLYICPPYLYIVATLPWETLKKSFFNSIIHIYFKLFTLSQKKTNCYLLARSNRSNTQLSLYQTQFT